MRLRSVWISDYKNLKDFSIDFEGVGLVDIFVGKNGSGKSNFQEALIGIFDHLFDFDPDEPGPSFDYQITFEIAAEETAIEWKGGKLSINGEKERRGLGQTPMPDHLLVYYSGHNPNVGELVTKYEDRFERKIDGPAFASSPKIVAITEGLKDLFLAMMMLLPNGHVGRQALIRRLGIKTVHPDIRLVLQRPVYARGRNSSSFDIDDLQGKKYWNPRGATGDFLFRLEQCFSSPPEQGPIRTEGYQVQADAYFLFLDIEKLRVEFAGDGVCSLFRQFFSLQILEMLSSVSVEVELESGFSGGTSGFSDGQFQMVYMLAAAELFKDRNILSLFDEPDAFLHPEWQFEFLKQIEAMSEQAVRTNHILLNSHSASTVAADTPARIRLFEMHDNGPQAIESSKSQVVSSLSAGLITFSEQEAQLNIRQILRNTTGPILFTEGVSDEIILETAWDKLNPGNDCPFEIQSAFSASFLRVLLSDQTMYDDSPNRKFFGIFDFDDAYNSWNINGEDIEVDPAKCLTIKRANSEGYLMLLPVPSDLSIRSQIINPDTGDHYKSEARLTIELLFKDVAGLEHHFEIDPTRPGNCVRFKGKKTRFASQVVSHIAAENFEVFRPVFDFIQSKIAAA